VFQELMRHASSRFTMEVYTQAKARRARTVLGAKPQRARGARWGGVRRRILCVSG